MSGGEAEGSGICRTNAVAYDSSEYISYHA